ncbi:MAG: hypothetical protein U1A78_26685 [Polyangia bacterium]
MKINVSLSVDLDGLQLARAEGLLSEVWARALVSLDAAELELMEQRASLDAQLGLVVLRALRNSVQETHRFVIAEERERLADSTAPRTRPRSTRRRSPH